MSTVFKSALSLGKHCPPENISFRRTLSLREHCLDEKDAVFWSGLSLDDTSEECFLLEQTVLREKCL